MTTLDEISYSDWAGEDAKDLRYSENGDPDTWYPKEFDVDVVPAYISSFSRRGNGGLTSRTPVFIQPRAPAREMAYLSRDNYMDNIANKSVYLGHFRQKKGNHGVAEQTWWAPGHDVYSNYGTSGLSVVKNYAGIQTKGNGGAPKRMTLMERPGFMLETLRPGKDHSTFPQNNNNYPGIMHSKRRDVTITRDVEPFVLKQMLENNPFHIHSYGAAQAKRMLAGKDPNLDTPIFYDIEENELETLERAAKEARKLG